MSAAFLMNRTPSTWSGAPLALPGHCRDERNSALGPLSFVLGAISQTRCIAAALTVEFVPDRQGYR
jgi:hypothetical protein